MEISGTLLSLNQPHTLLTRHPLPFPSLPRSPPFPSLPSPTQTHHHRPDLLAYGLIPEFINRLPSITALAPLTIPDLRRILTEVKGSLLSQYTSLFGYWSVEIRFTGDAIDAICRRAYERGGGARGLRGIMVSDLFGVRVGAREGWVLMMFCAGIGVAGADV